MAISCPKCSSTNIDRRNYGKRTVSTIAGLSGAVGGAMLGAKVAEEATDGSAGALGIIASATVGAITGAIAAAMAGATAGLALGATAGEAVDKHILDNFKCLDCNHTFNE